MEGLVKASKFNFGRMLFGDGSGILANIVSQTGNTLVLDSVRNLMEGMVIDLIHPASGSAIRGRRIVDVDRETKTIKVVGATIASNTFTAGDYITVQGSHNKELTGLGAIFGDSDTLYGLKRSEHRWRGSRFRSGFRGCPRQPHRHRLPSDSRQGLLSLRCGGCGGDRICCCGCCGLGCCGVGRHLAARCKGAYCSQQKQYSQKYKSKSLHDNLLFQKTVLGVTCIIAQKLQQSQ